VLFPSPKHSSEQLGNENCNGTGKAEKQLLNEGCVGGFIVLSFYTRQWPLKLFWWADWTVVVTLPPKGCRVLWWVCLSVYLSVCLSVWLSVHSHNSKTAQLNFTNFLYVACVCGSVLLWRSCDMLCTSSFMSVFMPWVKWAESSMSCYRRVHQLAIPVGCQITTVFGWVCHSAAPVAKSAIYHCLVCYVSYVGFPASNADICPVQGPSKRSFSRASIRWNQRRRHSFWPYTTTGAVPCWLLTALRTVVFYCNIFL